MIFVFQRKNRGKEGWKVTLLFEIIRLYKYNKYVLYTQYSTCIYYIYYIYTTFSIHTIFLSSKPGGAEEAETKEDIQELIGGGGPGGDTHLEFLRRVLQTIIKLNDEVKRLRQLFLQFSVEKL